MSEENLIKRLVRAEPVRKRDDPDHIRQLRRAVADAGDSVLGVRLGMTEVSERSVEMTALTDIISTEGLIQGYEFDGRTCAIWTFDRDCIRACVEAQTLGRINANASGDRDGISAIDAALTNALVEAILPAIDTSATPAAEIGQVFENPEEAVLALFAPHYKVVDLTLDFDRGAISGRVQAIVIETVRSLPNGTASGQNRKKFLGDVIGGASAVLEAELYRTDLSFDALRELKVGSMIPVPRDALSELRLRGATGKTVARGRLGQLNGRKAIRVNLQTKALAPPPPGPKAKAAPAADPPAQAAPIDAVDASTPVDAGTADGPATVPMAVIPTVKVEVDKT